MPTTDSTSISSPSGLSHDAPQAASSNAGNPYASKPVGSLFDRLPAAKMNAEAGYEAVSDTDVPPVRWSGFVCFLLGVLSFAATVAVPMLAVPVLAFVFGLVALRRAPGQTRPVGTSAAVLGMVLAAGFGACGVAIPYLKYRTMGGQAERFSRQFLEVLERGDFALAAELQKSAANRQLKSTNLDEFYASQKAKAAESGEDDVELGSGLMGQIHEGAGQIQWKLDGLRVFQKYGMEKADATWVDTSGVISQPIQIEMQWTPARDGQSADWHVTLFQFRRDPIYAPRVL